MLAHCNLKQNTWLHSKQSSFFPFVHCPLVANRKTQWSIKVEQCACRQTRKQKHFASNANIFYKFEPHLSAPGRARYSNRKLLHHHVEMFENFYLVKTSNSKFEMKSLQVRSMVDFNAMASSPVPMVCTSLSVTRNSFQGTMVL